MINGKCKAENSNKPEPNKAVKLSGRLYAFNIYDNFSLFALAHFQAHSSIIISCFVDNGFATLRQRNILFLQRILTVELYSKFRTLLFCSTKINKTAFSFGERFSIVSLWFSVNWTSLSVSCGFMVFLDINFLGGFLYEYNAINVVSSHSVNRIL